MIRIWNRWRFCSLLRETGWFDCGVFGEEGVGTSLEFLES